MNTIENYNAKNKIIPLLTYREYNSRKSFIVWPMTSYNPSFEYNILYTSDMEHIVKWQEGYIRGFWGGLSMN